MATMWNTDNTKSWDECGTTEGLSYIAVENAAGVEHSSVVSYKTKYVFTIWSGYHDPWYWSKIVENLCPHKNLHWMFIAALFMIAQTWKPPRCLSVGDWKKKEKIVHSDNRLLLSCEKKWVIRPWKDMEET